jgi:hypothetical protein
MAATPGSAAASCAATMAVPSSLPLSTMVTRLVKGKESSRNVRKVWMRWASCAASL